MSLAEIQREVEKLSNQELKALRAVVDQKLAIANPLMPPNALFRYLGCARGMMEFKPGWEEPAPAETGMHSGSRKMTHLLDTNAWLRVAQSPEELSPRIRDFMDRSVGPLALSAISIWEVCLKVRKGKLSLRAPMDEWLSLAHQPGFVQIIPSRRDDRAHVERTPRAFPRDRRPPDRCHRASARTRGNYE